MTTTRYRLRETHNTMGAFNGPLREHATPMYVQRIEMDTRRGMYGITRLRFTQDASKARTWATREAAERHAEQFTTDWRTVVVETVEANQEQTR